MRTARSASLGLASNESAGSPSHQGQQLSDIAEVSLSSRYSSLNSNELEKSQKDGGSNAANISGKSKLSLHDAIPDPPVHGMAPSTVSHTRWASRAMSTASLPLCEIPERRSSISNFNLKAGLARRQSLHEDSTLNAESGGLTGSVPAKIDRANSPVRNSLAKGTQSSDIVRRSPSRTFVRTTPAMDILDSGILQHPRFQISIRLPSPLFVGGSTVEGQLDLKCDLPVKKARLAPMWISRLSVDVLGVEEVGDGKRHIFLALANELFDEQHPPPPALVTTQVIPKGSELQWEMRSAQTVVPFCINLPLNLGPPPFTTKGACIKYLICPSARIKVGHKRVVVRHTLQCQMLTVHDPEKALGSLSSPLIASDHLNLAQLPGQTVKLTAGLHRQTWVNGSVLFIDLHIVNNSSKLLKRIDVHLEKSTLFYAHAAAGTADQSASHLRLPKRNETDVVSSLSIKRSNNWKGVLPQSSEVRTCELDVPRGHVTVGGGRYFEVRYFVRVLVSINMFKSLAVQLPVTVIHINSLDILPNALSQVAASIEAKRSKTVPAFYDGPGPGLYTQGQAFEAPRRQSLERARLDAINHVAAAQLADSISDYGLSAIKNTRRGGRDSSSALSAASHHHHERQLSCYHCHITDCEPERPHSSTYNGPKLPRLQVSTSGLGFSESEFEIPPDSPPKKVMMSEDERKMIRQQRELKMQRQWSRRSTAKENANARHVKTGSSTRVTGYRNVAVTANAAIPHEIGQRLSMSRSQKIDGRASDKPRALANVTTPNRKRSKTNPEGLEHMSRRPVYLGKSAAAHGRNAVKSMDRGHRQFRATKVADDGDVFYDVKASFSPTSPEHGMAMYGPRS